MTFDWAYALAVLPDLAQAALVTIQATLFGFLLALVLGLPLAIGRAARPRWIAWPVGLAIEFVRTTPLLVQLYFVYFVLPEWGLVLSAFATGVIVLGVHFACYTSEVYRAGIEAVGIGQWQAGRALGLGTGPIYLKVVLPQAIPPIIPQLGNYLIAMFKETPLLSAITVAEMLLVAKEEGSRSFRYLEPITIVGIFFLVMSVTAAAFVGVLERRYGKIAMNNRALAR